MTPPPGTPSDWVSGERVFAPPRGTVDVDWLVPAVLELVPGARPQQARTALERAWLRRRAAGPGDPGDPRARDADPDDAGVAGGGGAPDGPAATGPADPAGPAALAEAAERVVVEALETFGG